MGKDMRLGVSKIRSALFVFALVSSAANAQTSSNQATTRCATRLSIALMGTSPSSTLLASSDPQSMVPQLLKDSTFVEQFASYINSQFNEIPGNTPVEDAAYWLTKQVMTTNVKWNQMFIGPYGVTYDSNGNVTAITNDPNGLGFFTWLPWMQFYSGNEPAGIPLRMANHIMRATIGLHLIPVTNAPGVNISATGRMAAPCNSCHFNALYGLDYAAHVLPQKVVNSDPITFTPPIQSNLPVTQLLGENQPMTSESDFVHSLVNSTNFTFNACELAFKYLYGRTEYACEGPVFDKCMSAFQGDGMMQSAIESIAMDPSYCQ
jgi:hypothetical protein